MVNWPLDYFEHERYSAADKCVHVIQFKKIIWQISLNEKRTREKNGDEEKVDTLGESKSNGKLNQQTVYKKLLLEILITKVPALLPDHSKLMADNSILSLCHVVSVCVCARA